MNNYPSTPQPAPPNPYGYNMAPPGAPPPPPEGWQPPKPTSGKAIASLICALGGLLLGFMCGIGYLAVPVGLVLGIIGIAETGRNGKRSGRGIAIAGTVVSSLCLAATAVAIVFAVSMIKTGVEEAEQETSAQLEQDIDLIGERLKQYCARNGGTLHPGGPVLATGSDITAEVPGNEPPVEAETVVRGTLELHHLAAASELRAMRMENAKFTVTGAVTATLLIFGWDGEIERDIEFTNAAEGRRVQRYP